MFLACPSDKNCEECIDKPHICLSCEDISEEEKRGTSMDETICGRKL